MLKRYICFYRHLRYKSYHTFHAFTCGHRSHGCPSKPTIYHYYRCRKFWFEVTSFRLSTKFSCHSVTSENSRIKQVRINPGLSDVATKPKDITPYLNQLFTPIDSLLTAKAKQTTPVYLLGTAGFRVLDITKQKALLTSIRSSLTKVLSAHGYSTPPQAHVI